VDTSPSQTFTITVHPVNDAPTFMRGNDQVIDEDAGAQTVSVWATDLSTGPANETGQLLAFTLTSGNDTLFATLPTIDASTGDLTYAPADDLYGNATVTVTLQDDGTTANGGVDTSPSQTFTITVHPVNDAPVVSDVAKVAKIDAEIHFDATDFMLQFSDTDGDSLVQIQVLALPAIGTLNLNGVPVVVDQKIPVSDVGNLIFTTDVGWSGTTSFEWNGTDGMAYSILGALVNISISQVAYWVYLPFVANSR
jgi:hypothetical protein